MGLEIDFLQVGDGEKSGDAIALRWGDLHGPREGQTVAIIDGGFTDDGKALVQHLYDHYNTTKADIVVATHPDQDHVNGLKVVLNSLDVGQLCMHRPWARSDAVSLAKSSGFASTTMSAKIAKNFEAASELEEIATQRGIAIVEPFAGATTPDGVLTILSPTEAYYQELLDEMTKEQSPLASLLSQLTTTAGSTVSKAVEKEVVRILVEV